MNTRKLVHEGKVERQAERELLSSHLESLPSLDALARSGPNGGYGLLMPPHVQANSSVELLEGPVVVLQVHHEGRRFPELEAKLAREIQAHLGSNVPVEFVHRLENMPQGVTLVSRAGDAEYRIAIDHQPPPIVPDPGFVF